MPIRLDDDLLSDGDNVTVMFAVCNELNETCILSVPTVNLLNDVLNKKLLVCNNDNISESDSSHVSGGVNAVVTSSQSVCQPVVDEVETTESDVHESCNDNDNDVDHSDVTFIDVDEAVNIRSDIGVSNGKDFAYEQQNDHTLSTMWIYARRVKPATSLAIG